VFSVDKRSVNNAKLVVISGPSGVGKSTVVRRLLETCPQPIMLSVSATTRSPRDGEIDGVNYYFVSLDQFQRYRQAGKFLEFAEVFGRGDWYGTLRQPVLDALDGGKHVVLEIDVEGASMVLQQFPEALSIFVHPGSVDILERRLRGRRTESEEAIARRLAVANRELEQTCHYRHVIVNEVIEQTVSKICDLVVEPGE